MSRQPVRHLTRRPTSPPRREERGAAAVELAVLVPALVLMLGLVIAGGRLWFARATVVEAAQTTARAASLARTGSEATQEGQRAGRASLDTAGLRCAPASVTVDVGAFGVSAGTPATVRSRVSCSVPFSDLMLPGMPGSIRVHADGSAALDTYRGRS